MAPPMHSPPPYGVPYPPPAPYGARPPGYPQPPYGPPHAPPRPPSVTPASSSGWSGSRIALIAIAAVAAVAIAGVAIYFGTRSKGPRDPKHEFVSMMTEVGTIAEGTYDCDELANKLEAFKRDHGDRLKAVMQKLSAAGPSENDSETQDQVMKQTTKLVDAMTRCAGHERVNEAFQGLWQ
jgi:hypothetical protein